ncbi:DUF5047 domain-containing protein [Streptomyces harbinensis]|uniref:DUF5047 domain-containing protein n=1 Tax=Streptomyces harbinensis TaxID=1176198 RepID=UPI003685FE89
MYPPPSPGFLGALARSHRPYIEVQLIRTDGRSEVLPHTGGTVAADRGSAVRRTATVEVDDPALIPLAPADRLTVYGARLRILRGIAHADGRRELVPLGTFRVDEVSGDVDVGPVTITASGLEAYLLDHQLTEARRQTGGTTAVGGIRTLIEETLPWATVLNYATDSPVGSRTWDREDDRWAAITELATAIGAEVYADADGQFVIRVLPAVAPETVSWEVAAAEDGALISAVRGMSRAGVINSVTATGENTEDDTPPVSATIEDEDPTSPTYVGGPFGRVTHFHNSPLLTTVSACQAAAATILRDRRLPNATADITALPNPCLEPGDVIRVLYGTGARELHQVQSLRMDLGTGAMEITTISGQED